MRYPASPGGRAAIDQWLTCLPGGGPLVDSVALAPVLLHESFVHGVDEVRELWGSGAYVSWWGGPAVDTGQPWPHAADGTALDHLITVHLNELDLTVHPRERKAWASAWKDGLPTHGVLEVFLDRRELVVRDSPLSNVHLRWTASPSSALVEPPGATEPSAALCGLWLSGFTVPSPADAPDPTTSKAAASVWHTFDKTWATKLSGTSTSSGSSVPAETGSPSFAYGHSRRGRRQVDEVLGAATSGGRIEREADTELVLSLAQPVPGLLPPRSVLEVWIRQTDLAEGLVDRAICLLRDL